MPRHPRKPTLALALALCGLASLTTSAPASTTSASARTAATSALLGGFNTNGFGPGSPPAAGERTLATAQALHAKIVRLELQWSDLEPRAGGQIDPGALAYVDRFMSYASAHQIGVILLVDSTPCWASSAPEALLRSCVPGEHGAANAWQPKDPAD